MYFHQVRISLTKVNKAFSAQIHACRRRAFKEILSQSFKVLRFNDVT